MKVFGSHSYTLLKRAARAALIAMVAASPVLAQDAAPDVLLKAATADVIAIIRQEAAIPANNSATAVDRIEVRMQPLFDFTHMTQIAVARNWRAATPTQRQALVTEFRTVLVRHYTASLSAYGDRVIEFRPLRAASAATEITVKTLVKQPGAKPLTVDYDMEKRAMEWKVYDIKIDGLSVVSAYRETFAGKVREGGLEALITSLADTNRRSDAPIRVREKEEIYFPLFVWGILQGVR